eukprot:COSAG02_NODE_63230_length_263_cov_1.780488_1_plen_29_part_10
MDRPTHILVLFTGVLYTNAQPRFVNDYET